MYRPGDFELIPTVKMETGLPVQGSFGNKFPSNYTVGFCQKSTDFSVLSLLDFKMNDTCEI